MLNYNFIRARELHCYIRTWDIIIVGKSFCTNVTIGPVFVTNRFIKVVVASSLLKECWRTLFAIASRKSAIVKLAR